MGSWGWAPLEAPPLPLCSHFRDLLPGRAGHSLVSVPFRELRALVIEMVLATDMSCHFQQVKSMKTALQQLER